MSNNPLADTVEDILQNLGLRKVLTYKITILGFAKALLIPQLLVELWLHRSIGIHFTPREVKYMKFALVIQNNQRNL